MRHVKLLQRHNFDNFKVSLKASDVFMTVAAYRLIADRLEQPFQQ
jgi:(E)-4-hydroxy-3-methylbut-2-enyl-diphosphate synthase